MFMTYVMTPYFYSSYDLLLSYEYKIILLYIIFVMQLKNRENITIYVYINSYEKEKKYIGKSVYYMYGKQ